ncbi:hypothetical protein PAXRUDRAFT_822600 [Paxillus rubicundulus Ve08.2h10]|uniref:Uncharacterized protein n=1 Tax=Paxillus rubicundulus Ve08.2h10 TaxID=930991 RepID=A0A0D0E9N9_9AGAM|nr:hypothetical protein PAXRUDRAFT_822600 [Paxillus rubicundulus Ve08.2h10]
MNELGGTVVPLVHIYKPNCERTLASRRIVARVKEGLYYGIRVREPRQDSHASIRSRARPIS